MKILNAWICQINNNSVKPIFGELEIEDGIITSINPKEFKVGNFSSINNSNAIDAKGRVITVPNVNYHDHIYSRLAKGLTINKDMSNFPNILKNLWWKLDSLLDLDMIKASSQMAAIESIKNGVTYIIDHHSSPYSANNSLKIIAENLESFKLRNVLCFETTDRNGEVLKEKGFEENLSFLENNTSENSKSLLGLHASFTINDETLQHAVQLVQKYNWGVHVHLCEDISDLELSNEKYNATPMKRFANNELLNGRSILAHGIHLNKEDFELIRDSNAALVFNLDSNMNNSVGLQKYKMIPKDIPILIGTDGMHSNIARSTKELFLQIRHAGFTFDEAFAFTTKTYFDQLKFIKNFFPDFTNLQINDRADLIIWDYVPPTPINQDNFWGHYIYGILERPIMTVVQKGEFLVSNFNLINIDETKINNEIFIQGERLFTEFNKGN